MIVKLDGILNIRGFKNEDLVKASTQQLTFKQVQKARSGRKVTLNIQYKILQAVNICSNGVVYQWQDLFGSQVSTSGKQ